jgi:hypothetical protein
LHDFISDRGKDVTILCMVTKICLGCRLAKELDLFPRSGARYLNYCFECDKLDTPSVRPAKRGGVERSVILCVGDLHFPFGHPDAIQFIAAVKERFQPTKTILLGDEIDAHGLSNWDQDPNGRSAEDEHVLALVELHKLYKVVPEALVCESNHTSRIYKRGFKEGIPERFFRDYAEILEAPSTWYWDDHWDVEGIRFEHGESFGGVSGAMRSAIANMQSTVIGHIHAHASINWIHSPTNQIFSMNVGCLIAEKEYAFHYAKYVKARPWIGLGLIEDGVPRLIPMKMDKHGRWTGVV